MALVGESDSSLASQCMALCQALNSQGKAFKFSLSIGSSFCFSLDTRDEAPTLDIKSMASARKKPSPSTLRRNARRRAEFLTKKQNPAAKLPVRPLKVFPSPIASSERRQVVSLGKDPAIPSFSQLDGAATPSSAPGAPPSSHPCPPAPFDKPCTGDFCGSNRDPTATYWETECDKCWRHMCSYSNIVKRCNVNCGLHHCHKSLPGDNVVWSFTDKDSEESHCPNCPCPPLLA